jgi:AcrR family transcriptional regulator
VLGRRRPAAATRSGTRTRLIDAALQTLTSRGFSGTTARAIAVTARANQALIFYHFGSVDNLLLAALDATSERRLRRYRERLADVTQLSELVERMSALYAEDVRLGHVAAVQELIAGGSSVPALRPEVVARLDPWIRLAEEIGQRVLSGSLLEPGAVIHELAFAAVALYLGIETLTHLQGDRAPAEALFLSGRRFAPLLDAVLSIGRMEKATQ